MAQRGRAWKKTDAWFSPGARARVRLAAQVRGAGLALRILAAAWTTALLLGVGAGALGIGLAFAFEGLATPSMLAVFDLVVLGALVGVAAGVPFLAAGPKIRVAGPLVGALWGAITFAAVAALVRQSVSTVLAAVDWPAAALILGSVVLLFISWGVLLERTRRRLAGIRTALASEP